MTTKATEELSVYRVGYEEWWIARSAEHAIEQSSAMSGAPVEDYENDASLMSEEDLLEFLYHDEDGSKFSGTEQVRRLQNSDEWKAGPFAFADY